MLDAKDNCLESPTSLLPLSGLGKLVELILKSNPVSLLDNYKLAVQTAAPFVTILDGNCVVGGGGVGDGDGDGDGDIDLSSLDVSIIPSLAPLDDSEEMSMSMEEMSPTPTPKIDAALAKKRVREREKGEGPVRLERIDVLERQVSERFERAFWKTRNTNHLN